jgi:hypothetical protein
MRIDLSQTNAEDVTRWIAANVPKLPEPLRLNLIEVQSSNAIWFVWRRYSRHLFLQSPHSVRIAPTRQKICHPQV